MGPIDVYLVRYFFYDSKTSYLKGLLQWHGQMTVPDMRQ